MFQLIGSPLWPWLALWSLIGVALGVLASWFWPGGVLRAHVYKWRPISAAVAGFFAGVLIARYVISSPLLVTPIALVVTWWWSRRPEFNMVGFIARLIRQIERSQSHDPVKPEELIVER